MRFAVRVIYRLGDLDLVRSTVRINLVHTVTRKVFILHSEVNLRMKTLLDPCFKV